MRFPIVLLLAAALATACRSEPDGEPGARDVGQPIDPRALAATHFAAGRYAEAEGIYRELIAAAPDDPALRASLAGALGALGKVEEASTELEKVIAGDPLNSAAYHNRAVLHERKGERELAIADYRHAVRYNPRYEPSRQALERLTGSADPSPPKSDAERLAIALSERAAEDARAGNYDAALTKLAEAERVAPMLAIVHHHRSNVAYLKGDRAGAIASLDRALVLEPDNALFRMNRSRLGNEGAPVIAGDAAPAATPAK